jgi:hypothetical protein
VQHTFTFMKRPSIRVTFVVIAVAAAAAVAIGDLARHAAGRKLRETILAELQPVALKNCTLKRFGNANDGGYVMCENLIEPLDAGYRTALAGTTTGVRGVAPVSRPGASGRLF